MTAVIDSRAAVKSGGEHWAYSLLIADPDGKLWEYVWCEWGFWAPGNKTKFLGLDDKSDEEKNVKLNSIATTNDGFLFGVASTGRVYAFDRTTERSKDIPQPNSANPGGLSREELEEKEREWAFKAFLD
jgi:hypothetical protein